MKEALLPSSTLYSRKLELMPLHIDPRTTKRHALHAQPESLLRAILSRQFDRASRPKHPLPRQSRNLPQNPHHLPRPSRPSRRPRNRAITCNFSGRQRANQPHNPLPLLRQSFFRTALSRRRLRRFPSSRHPLPRAPHGNLNVAPTKIYRCPRHQPLPCWHHTNRIAIDWIAIKLDRYKIRSQ